MFAFSPGLRVLSQSQAFFTHCGGSRGGCGEGHALIKDKGGRAGLFSCAPGLSDRSRAF